MNKKNNQSMQEYERNNLSEEIKISIINSLEKVFNGQNGRFAIGAFTLIILSTQVMDYFKKKLNKQNPPCIVDRFGGHIAAADSAVKES